MTRALIAIDVQESFRQLPDWAAIDRPDIAERVGVLVDAAREDGDLVVWVLHTMPDTGTPFDPVSGYVRLLDGLEARADEPVVRKTSINAFTSTNLAQLLTRNGVREVAICGIKTEQCCETTARVAGDLGYDVTFVLDANGTTPIEHRDATPGRTLEDVLADPLTLRPEQIAERTAYALSGRFATIRTVDEVLAGRAVPAG